ncbi:hypothetical protein Rrhod_3544 [Rhodococcus rhodnii LMG 5362]|uniref:Uncharacterized protein n=1 Tax=Rhodococcus rhodnii LMG 5362 TaxID=1273125 RepID=R7WM90_9NOCA|nr:hypothetical protein Rrhod_3544 [Rhodococcus rhodnii LMG 5362]
MVLPVVTDPGRPGLGSMPNTSILPDPPAVAAR